MRTTLVFLIAITLAACSNNSDKADEVNKDGAQIEVDAPAITVYGDSISEQGALDPKDFLAQMEGKDTLNGKLKAVIKETCSRKGCWMNLDMGNGKEMSVKFKDYGFFVPTEGMEGKTAIVEGKAYTDTVSVDELKHLAEDAGKSKDEIAQITEPQVGTSFEAKGVLIEK